LAVLLFALSRLKKRRRMLAETNDRREYLQGLLDSIPNGIVAFVRNPDDTLTVNYLNDGFYRMLLIPKERSREPEADFKSALYPGDELLLRAEMHRSRTEHDNFYSTFRLKNQNGKYIWVTLQAAPAGRDTDQPAYYGAFTNMDDMKHVQEQLEESSASLRTAMSHAGMCYWEYDPEEHISLQDEKSQIELNLPEMMHDYPESLFALGVIPQEDIPIYKDAVRKIDVGAVESSCEVRNILTGGGSRWVRVQMTSIYGQDGERLKVLGTATDITEQRNAAVEYERQLAQVRSALSDPLVFFRVNLTKNYYSSAESAHEELVKTENRSADSLFEAIYSRAVTEEEKEAFKARFGRMVDVESLMRKWKWILAFNVGFICLLIPFGTVSHGNRAWIQFSWMPTSIQPAEIVKLTFILLMAKQLEGIWEQKREMRQFTTVLPPAAHLLFMVALIYGVSGDMGSALVYVFIFLCMALAAGMAVRWFLLGFAAAGAGIFGLYELGKIPKYMVDRFHAIFDHSFEPLGAGWQQTRSLLAIGSGRWLGQGLFHGTQTQSATASSLPYRHTDFIFAAAGEELGFVGCLVIIALLVAIIFRCLQVARYAKAPFASYVCVGMAGMLIFQTIENIGMCLFVMTYAQLCEEIVRQSIHIKRRK
jgi:Bacterial cell division membrane protein